MDTEPENESTSETDAYLVTVWFMYVTKTSLYGPILVQSDCFPWCIFIWFGIMLDQKRGATRKSV